MALQFIASSVVNSNAAFDVPAHNAGDLIIVVNFGSAISIDSLTIPGFTKLTSNMDNTYTASAVFAVYYNSNSPGGTVNIPATDAAVTRRFCMVYRGHKSSAPFGTIASRATGLLNTEQNVVYPACAFVRNTSWAIAISAYTQTGGTEVVGAPANLTLRQNSGVASTYWPSVYDSNGALATYPQTNGPALGAARRNRATVIELTLDDTIFANETSTLADVTSTASAVLALSAVATPTVGDVTLTSLSAVEVTAALTATIDAVTLTGDARLPIQSGDTTQIDDITVASTAAVGIAGNVATGLDDVTLTSASALEIQASLTAVVGTVTTTTSAALAIQVTDAVMTLDAVTLQGDARLPIQASEDMTQIADVTLNSEAIISLIGELTATIDDIGFSSEAKLDIQATMVATVFGVDPLDSDANLPIDVDGGTAYIGDVTSDSEAKLLIQADAVAEIVGVTAQATAEASVKIRADVDVILGAVTLLSNATITQIPDPAPSRECCTPRICDIDPCSLICNFIDLLPSGPLWDRSKAEVKQHYTGS